MSRHACWRAFGLWTEPAGGSRVWLPPLLLLLFSCSGDSEPGPATPAGSPAASAVTRLPSVPGYTPPPATVPLVSATPTPTPGTRTATPVPTLPSASPLPAAAQDVLRDYLAGRGLTLSGACLAITADPGESAHCYLVLEGSTLDRLRLVVGRWASGQAVGVDIERDPAGAYRIVDVRTPTASP